MSLSRTPIDRCSLLSPDARSCRRARSLQGTAPSASKVSRAAAQERPGQAQPGPQRG
ncbi:hypothetical protein AB0C10_03805 [Microbispora amethystogenes]